MREAGGEDLQFESIYAAMSETVFIGELPTKEWRVQWIDFPHIDELLNSCLDEKWTGADVAGGHVAKGEMEFNHLGLQGPPGRVHGGRQVSLRLFTILDRIAEHTPDTAFPCAFNMRFRKAIALNSKTPFEVRYLRNNNGGWNFYSRFHDSDRLDAHAWSLASDDFVSQAELDIWRDKYEEAKNIVDPEVEKLTGEKLENLGSYRGAKDMRWMRIDPADTRVAKEFYLNRYDTDKGLSFSFLAEQLDVIGGGQRSREIGVPAFTTRFALRLATRHLPNDEPLIFITDVSRRTPTPFSPLKPVDIDGQMLGTETSEVLAVNDDFTKVYGHGWLDSHPADLKKLGMDTANHPFIKKGRSNG